MNNLPFFYDHDMTTTPCVSDVASDAFYDRVDAIADRADDLYKRIESDAHITDTEFEQLSALLDDLSKPEYSDDEWNAEVNDYESSVDYIETLYNALVSAKAAD